MRAADRYFAGRRGSGGRRRKPGKDARRPTAHHRPAAQPGSSRTEVRAKAHADNPVGLSDAQGIADVIPVRALSSLTSSGAPSAPVPSGDRTPPDTLHRSVSFQPV